MPDLWKPGWSISEKGWGEVEEGGLLGEEPRLLGLEARLLGEEPRSLGLETRLLGEEGRLLGLLAGLLDEKTALLQKSTPAPKILRPKSTPRTALSQGHDRGGQFRASRNRVPVWRLGSIGTQ